jgi:SOS-response transcriptional repressor LexA
VLTFDATVWEYDGPSAWHFVSLPADVADEVLEVASSGRAFGSVPVEVTIGRTSWQTSLFPDSRRATYVLPVKKSVRVAEGLSDGDRVTVRLTVAAPPQA